MSTEKRKKKKSKVPGILEKIFDIIDLISNFLPGKAATLMLVVGLGAGGLVGYNAGVAAGIDQVVIPECPTCDVCEVCEECPEQVECPEIPECPRPIESYTCEEASASLPGCLCILE